MTQHKISKRAGEQTVYQGKYISVKLLDGWYEFLRDGTGKFVAVLGYRRIGKDAWEYLGRYENCPPHKDGIALCSLTGGMEEDEEPTQSALRELKEESGITTDEELESLGTVRSSKASDSTGYLFAVDLSEVPDQPKYTGKGDGTKGEEGSYCKWVSREEAINAKDTILITMIARLGF
jgi:8-oxo-dGTP pyrophosphatase MutT (NUDIX family)